MELTSTTLLPRGRQILTMTRDRYSDIVSTFVVIDVVFRVRERLATAGAATIRMFALSVAVAVVSIRHGGETIDSPALVLIAVARSLLTFIMRRLSFDKVLGSKRLDGMGKHRFEYYATSEKRKEKETQKQRGRSSNRRAGCSCAGNKMSYVPSCNVAGSIGSIPFAVVVVEVDSGSSPSSPHDRCSTIHPCDYYRRCCCCHPVVVVVATRPRLQLPRSSVSLIVRSDVAPTLHRRRHQNTFGSSVERSNLIWPTLHKRRRRSSRTTYNSTPRRSRNYFSFRRRRRRRRRILRSLLFLLRRLYYRRS